MRVDVFRVWGSGLPALAKANDLVRDDTYDDDETVQ